jgi:hypothetical protein
MRFESEYLANALDHSKYLRDFGFYVHDLASEV